MSENAPIENAEFARILVETGAAPIIELLQDEISRISQSASDELMRAVGNAAQKAGLVADQQAYAFAFSAACYLLAESHRKSVLIQIEQFLSKQNLTVASAFKRLAEGGLSGNPAGISSN